ncbi:MAG: substrate-binding domain-containing protein [Planctomycetes bacterium]|nr:substrate-binding domain-containing protein [Planctomycetota bacterium]
MKSFLVLSVVSLSLFTAGCGDAKGAAAARPKVAFVSNCVAEFWAIAQRGAEAAAKEQGVEVLVKMPPTGTAAEQQSILEDLLAKGVRGIAVSPKDPANMGGLLDQIAARTLLVTHDSDAPASKRLAYIGMRNYDAGRLCGQMIREALPKGGPIVLLVATLDQDNARGRRQGIIDELLGRSVDAARFDAQDAALSGNGFEIRATYTDQFDPQKGKAVIEDALGRWQDLAGVVGLFEYEPPLVLEAVKAAKRLDRVKVFGFDENDQTLQGIVDGEVAGTLVQNPYEYGYQSVTLLARLLQTPDEAQRRALLPAGGFMDIPARRIDKSNVRAFWDDLKQKTGRK